MTEAEAIAAGLLNADGSPGMGGVNRGRADAPMIWGDESTGQEEKFQTRMLPGAKYMDMEHSEVLGVGSAAPTVDGVGEGGGGVDVSASAGKTAWRRRLSPHHRSAVGTFFTREGK